MEKSVQNVRNTVICHFLNRYSRPGSRFLAYFAIATGRRILSFPTRCTNQNGKNRPTQHTRPNLQELMTDKTDKHTIIYSGKIKTKNDEIKMDEFLISDWQKTIMTLTR